MRFLFALVAFFIFCGTATAQHYRHNHNFVDGGILLGLTSYSGDVSERRIEPREFQPGYGFFVRYHFNKNFALKAHVYSGSISGDDKNNPSLKPRSYKFGASIVETALVAEWAFGSRDRYSSTGLHRAYPTPYIFAGVGMTFADPTAEYYGPADQRNQWLKTPLPEDNIQRRFLLVPVGAGLQFDVTERVRLGGEVGFRPVFSDDLDGIAINGNPDEGDWYYFGGVTISIILADASARQ
jgi:OmpA-OmpF porin, OOP family